MLEDKKENSRKIQTLDDEISPNTVKQEIIRLLSKLDYSRSILIEINSMKRRIMTQKSEHWNKLKFFLP